MQKNDTKVFASVWIVLSLIFEISIVVDIKFSLNHHITRLGIARKTRDMIHRVLTYNSYKTQAYYLTLGIEFRVFFCHMSYHKIKMPSSEKISILDLCVSLACFELPKSEYFRNSESLQFILGPLDQ